MELYTHPAASNQIRCWCAKEILRTDTTDVEQIKLCARELEHLPPGQTADEALHRIEAFLDIDFSASSRSLQNAAGIARGLSGQNYGLSNDRRCLGLHALLVEKNQGLAEEHFDAALKKDPRDSVAWMGLLIVALQLDRMGDVDVLLTNAPAQSDPDVNDLCKLADAMLWLNRTTENETSPLAAAEIESLGFSTGVEEQIACAASRLYLIEGDAHKAAECFLPLANTKPDHVVWAYYAAWIQLLTGDRETAFWRYNTMEDSTSQWPLAALLLDGHPDRIKSVGGLEKLKNAPEPFTDPMKAKCRLATTKQADEFTWTPSEEITPERLEVLRTVLGAAYAAEEWSALQDAIESPVFARLPRAERLLWEGLAALPNDIDKGVDALREASALGHPRAFLVLAVYFAHRGKIAESLHALNSSPYQNDVRADRLRAHLAAIRGRTTDAEKLLESLQKRGAKGSLYAQGRLKLIRTASVGDKKRRIKHIRELRREAAELLQTAIDGNEPGLPDDAEALARCASFSVVPDKNLDACAEIWPQVAAMNSDDRSPWLFWTAAIAQLASGQEEISIDDCEKLVRMALDSVPVSPDMCLALVGAFATACRLTTDPVRASQLSILTDRLAAESDQAAVAPLIERVRLAVSCDDIGTTSQESLDKLDQKIPGSVGLGLVLACQALEKNESAAAVKALDECQTRDELESRLVMALKKFATGVAPEQNDLPSPSVDSHPALIAACNLIQAGARFLEGKTKEGFDALLLARRRYDISSVVDLTRYVLWFCARSTETGQLPDFVEKAIEDFSSNVSEDSPVVARCLVATGDIDKGLDAFRKIVKNHPDPNYPVRTELAGLLCHMAVKEFHEGNIQKTIFYLKEVLDLDITEM